MTTECTTTLQTKDISSRRQRTQVPPRHIRQSESSLPKCLACPGEEDTPAPSGGESSSSGKGTNARMQTKENEGKAGFSRAFFRTHTRGKNSEKRKANTTGTIKPTGGVHDYRGIRFVPSPWVWGGQGKEKKI